MKDFLKFIEDYVFSFGTFCVLFVIVFMLCLYAAVTDDMKRQEQTRERTEACYAQGLVLVDTDAGQRCVAPQSLVKVK